MHKIKSGAENNADCLKDPYVAPKLMKLQELGILTLTGNTEQGKTSDVFDGVKAW